MVEVVVVSSDNGTEADEVKKKIDGGGASSEVVRWEKYLPKMVLRVLLVEADDSTRQIITALLRKCSYIVAAVPDGLMAWETLKGRPQNIDLILTELDLPSISGFALLTLVMEHEICKNIPVIMMSSQDSVSTVLKCMLRGAADYLIKPVRKNELRNLWQHVWRRHAACAETVHHNLLDSQPNLEATAENSTDSRDYLTSNYKNLNKIGNDAQVKQANDSISLGFESKLMENTKSMKESTMHLDQKEENLDGAVARNTEKIESSNTTMDLIGAFDEQSKHFHGDNHSIEQFGPELELSLKRFSFRRISKDEDEIERQKLCHSNNSAFTICRYDKAKTIVTSSSSSELKKVRSFEMPSATTSSNQENIGSCISGQFGQAKEQQDPHFMGNPNVRQSIETMNSLRESNTLEIGCQSTCTNSCEDEGIAGESGSRQKWKEEEHVDGFKGSTDPQRVSQREAALTKFRMKRKDRCFEKKVRYESRKKLAEQRPRVKGQFVRAPHVSSNGA